MIIQMIQEGGPGAYLAVALGLLGLLLGGVALVTLLGKSRASFALGVVSLIVAMAAAGAGMVGTGWGRSQVTRALASVDSEVDKDRIMHAGFREAQSASWIGLFASLIPLALGAAAAIGGSRLQQPRPRAQAFGDPMASAEEGLAGQTVVAFLFTAIGVIAAGGAWAMAHSAPPKLRYNFDEHDTQSWSLAGALEDVKKDRQNACRDLSEALDAYWGATDRREWPRKMTSIPPELAGWRAAADGCAKKALALLGEPEELEGRSLTREELLESPLLQDEALHEQLLAWKPKTREVEEPTEPATAILGLGGLGGPPKEAKVGAGSLEPAQIRAVIQRNLGAIRFCYERELTKAPKLEGKLVVSFTIGKEGDVVAVVDASTEAFPSAKVTSCVLSRFKAMKFPRPSGGGVVTVKYPLVFKAAG